MAVDLIVKNNNVEWVDVESPTKADLEHLNKTYGINMLMLEDTIETNHLPKFEENEEVKFYLLRENFESSKGALNTISDVSTKLSIFIKENTVITVHRANNRSITEFKEELPSIKNEIKAHEIVFRLAHKVLDTYDDEAARLMDKLDVNENEIFTKRVDATSQLRKLYRIKRKSGLNSRILILSAEVIQQLKRMNFSQSEYVDIKDKYQDVMADFDHLNAQINNLISMFLALSDQKANQVMKLLAIYSFYFLPITFIAGVYGMNFDVMPELHHPLGYFITLGVMALITLITFLYFRRKKW